MLMLFHRGLFLKTPHWGKSYVGQDSTQKGNGLWCMRGRLWCTGMKMKVVFMISVRRCCLQQWRHFLTCHIWPRNVFGTIRLIWCSQARADLFFYLMVSLLPLGWLLSQGDTLRKLGMTCQSRRLIWPCKISRLGWCQILLWSTASYMTGILNRVGWHVKQLVYYLLWCFAKATLYGPLMSDISLTWLNVIHWQLCMVI